MGAYLAFWITTCLRIVRVLNNITLAKIVVFDCFLAVENGVRTRKQIEVVVVVPIVVEVSPGLGLTEEVGEVSFTATRETLESKGKVRVLE